MDIGEIFKGIFKFIEGGLKALFNIRDVPEPPSPKVIVVQSPVASPPPSASVPEPPPRVITEDYINSIWTSSQTPIIAIEKMEAELQNPTQESLRMSTNTCKRLIENFSMLIDRRKRLENIRDKIMRFDSDMAREINMERFSTADWYDGPPNLWR